MTEQSESGLAVEAAQGTTPADDWVEEQPWEPAPLPASNFVSDDGWVNINRAPYDRMSGVVYKRAMAVKSICYAPLDPAPELPALWRGHGEAVIRWLFSEEPGMEEGLLQNREFRALQTLTLSAHAATGERCHPGQDTILCVLDGQGILRHREMRGAPIVQRPLRKGDLVLIPGDTRYSIGNDNPAISEAGNAAPGSSCTELEAGDVVVEDAAFHVLVLHLTTRDSRNGITE